MNVRWSERWDEKGQNHSLFIISSFLRVIKSLVQWAIGRPYCSALPSQRLSCTFVFVLCSISLPLQPWIFIFRHDYEFREIALLASLLFLSHFSFPFLHFPPFRHPFPSLSSCCPSFVSPLPPPNVYHLIPLFLDLFQSGHSHDSFPPLSPSLPSAAWPFPLPDTLRDCRQWLRWRRSAGGVLCWVVAVRREGRKALWNICLVKEMEREDEKGLDDTRTNLKTDAKKDV